MTERKVNTLMAGAKAARSTRGRYTAAGYSSARDRQMYIADVPAGSAQDALRDLNRPGYRSDRPWHETPAPAFEAQAAVAAPAPRIAPRRRARKQSFIEWLGECARREKKDVVLCVVLLSVILMMGAVWGRSMIAGVEIQRSIDAYRSQTIAFERENERLSQQLEMAKSGERIRNLAQNELNMLRPERAQHETIYIQPPAESEETKLQQNEEPRMEMLDILLGLLNVFHIGE